LNRQTCLMANPGNTSRGSITVTLLTSCLIGLESAG
jgi:hypothetical protein